MDALDGHLERIDQPRLRYLDVVIKPAQGFLRDHSIFLSEECSFSTAEVVLRVVL